MDSGSARLRRLSGMTALFRISMTPGSAELDPARAASYP